MSEPEYPEFIYHYTKAENLFKILPEMRLKLSKLIETNDPKEKLKQYSFEFNSDQSGANLIDFASTLSLEKNKVVCFSSDKDQVAGFNLPTMWAHYAENYKGVCLKIKTQIFLERNQYSIKSGYIDYSTREDFNVYNSVNDAIHKIGFCKRKEWDSEQEWRIFTDEGIKF